MFGVASCWALWGRTRRPRLESSSRGASDAGGVGPCSPWCPTSLRHGDGYAVPAIALALTLFGIGGRTAKDVQARVGVGGENGLDGRRWRMLDRWPLAILSGELFERVRAPMPEERSTKRTAAAFFSRQLAALSRLIVGPIAGLAMDGALMAIGPGSTEEARPPSRSTPRGGPAIA